MRKLLFLLALCGFVVSVLAQPPLYGRKYVQVGWNEAWEDVNITNGIAGALSSVAYNGVIKLKPGIYTENNWSVTRAVRIEGDPAWPPTTQFLITDSLFNNLETDSLVLNNLYVKVTSNNGMWNLNNHSITAYNCVFECSTAVLSMDAQSKFVHCYFYPLRAGGVSVAGDDICWFRDGCSVNEPLGYNMFGWVYGGAQGHYGITVGGGILSAIDDFTCYSDTLPLYAYGTGNITLYQGCLVYVTTGNDGSAIICEDAASFTLYEASKIKNTDATNATITVNETGSGQIMDGLILENKGGGPCYANTGTGVVDVGYGFYSGYLTMGANDEENFPFIEDFLLDPENSAEDTIRLLANTTGDSIIIQGIQIWADVDNFDLLFRQFTNEGLLTNGTAAADSMVLEPRASVDPVAGSKAVYTSQWTSYSGQTQKWISNGNALWLVRTADAANACGWKVKYIQSH
jgi:hypothetical protein